MDSHVVCMFSFPHDRNNNLSEINDIMDSHSVEFSLLKRAIKVFWVRFYAFEIVDERKGRLGLLIRKYCARNLTSFI